jgi:hypothetical protein
MYQKNRLKMMTIFDNKTFVTITLIQNKLSIRSMETQISRKTFVIGL